jgi:hypothetical protein
MVSTDCDKLDDDPVAGSGSKFYTELGTDERSHHREHSDLHTGRKLYGSSSRWHTDRLDSGIRGDWVFADLAGNNQQWRLARYDCCSGLRRSGSKQQQRQRSACFRKWNGNSDSHDGNRFTCAGDKPHDGDGHQYRDVHHSNDYVSRRLICHRFGQPGIGVDDQWHLLWYWMDGNIP